MKNDLSAIVSPVDKRIFITLAIAITEFYLDTFRFERPLTEQVKHENHDQQKHRSESRLPRLERERSRFVLGHARIDQAAT